MDGASGFAASTRSKHPLALHSNCSWGLFVAEFKKRATTGHISTDITSAETLWLSGRRHAIRWRQISLNTPRNGNLLCSWVPLRE